MPLSFFIISILIGCAPSSDEYLEAPQTKRSTPEKDVIKAEDKTVKDMNDKLSPQVPASKKEVLFDKAGLLRLETYLNYATKAHIAARTIAKFTQILALSYDWKNDPKTEIKYLKGGTSDPLGKLFYELSSRRQIDEAASGLISIIQDDTFFKELMTYFMDEKMIDSKKTLPLIIKAIESKDLDALENAIDRVYVNFLNYYGHYYHRESKWNHAAGKLKNESEPTKLGFGLNEMESLVEEKKPLNKEELNELRKKGVRIPPGMTPAKMVRSELRVEVVRFISILILKYFNIEPVKKEIEKKEPVKKPTDPKVGKEKKKDDDDEKDDD